MIKMNDNQLNDANDKVKQTVAQIPHKLPNEMTVYRDVLKNAARQKLPDIIFNSGRDNAACLVSAILDVSQKSFKALCLDENIELFNYEVVERSVKAALEKKIQVNILTNSSDFSKNIPEYLSKHTQILSDEAYKHLKTNSSNKMLLGSFVVGDNDMFRLEYIGEEALGIGSFSDAEMADALDDFFYKIKGLC